jgi:hypothetical protein
MDHKLIFKQLVMPLAYVDYKVAIRDRISTTYYDEPFMPETRIIFPFVIYWLVNGKGSLASSPTNCARLEPNTYLILKLHSYLAGLEEASS